MSEGYMQGDHDNSTAVPFSDDEAEAKELFDEDKPDASPEERVTRKQKRQARLQQLLTEGKQSKEETASLRAEQQQLKSELDRLKGYISAKEQQQPKNDGKDPYEARLDAVYSRQQEAYNSAQAEIAANKFTPERQAHYERVAREIESEKTRIHTERAVAANDNAMMQRQAQQVWVQKYPDVYRNPKAFKYAQALWAQREALGESGGNEVVDEIMAETMTRFKLGAKPAPTASDRSRMSGVPSAGGGGGTKTSGALPPELRRIAESAYPDIPPAEAHKKWEQKTGKRLRDRKVI